MKLGLVLFFFVSYLNLFSQFNILTGYDYGLIQLEKITSATTDEKVKWNSVQRFNSNVEYLLPSKFLFSLDLGVDTYHKRIKYVSTQKNIVEKRSVNAKIITLRNQLSFGYLFNFDEKNSLVFKISSGIYSVLDIKILESTFEKKVFKDDTHEGIPLSSIIEYNDRTYFKKESQNRSAYLSGFNLLQTSIEYRYTFNDWNCNLFVGYTPIQKEIIQRFNNNNLFLLGIRLGYTLPQKTKNNEK